MKAKITHTTQFNNTSHGFEAKLHTAGDNTALLASLKATGFEWDFEEPSDENGFDFSYSVFSGDCTFNTKAEFVKCLRADIVCFLAYGYIKQ